MESPSAPASPAAPCCGGSPSAAAGSCAGRRDPFSLGKVLPAGFSIEDIVARCQRACPLSRVEKQMRIQIAALEEERRQLAATQRQLQQEGEEVVRIRLELEAELGALRDARSWLQTWYRHRDGRLKKRWLVLAAVVLTGGLCYCDSSKSSTPAGRCLQRILAWWQEWREHASAVTDDMAVMGPFIHMAAEIVRTVNDSEVVRLSSDAVAHKETRIEYMAM
mmetsp:Transcript_12290/g.38834  ORF Transcript_12290/g.38834 Transcript_12290/m.38834 type:complete len:221 (+) Transcript_12290:27-689(+)